MKEIITVFTMLAFSFTSFSQTCEEREQKLLESIGTLSAGFFYNTYGLIGSLADGYEHDAYSASTVTDLLNAQNKLAGNMIIYLEKMVSDNILKDQEDKDYVTSSANLLKGFKTQIGLLLTLVNSKTQKNINAYEEQRNKNWKELSRMMGIDE